MKIKIESDYPNPHLFDILNINLVEKYRLIVKKGCSRDGLIFFTTVDLVNAVPELASDSDVEQDVPILGKE